MSERAVQMPPPDIRRAYAVLGLSPPVSKARLKQQYRRLVGRWHPDQYTSDPAGQEEAAQRMREINDAYHLVAQALQHPGDLVVESPAQVTTTGMSSRLSRDRIDGIVAAINNPRAGTAPQMSTNRWLGLAALAGYTVVPQLIFAARVAERPEIKNAVGKALAYFWLPLFFIWLAEAERTPVEAKRPFLIIGWILMAAPALAGVVWMLSR